MFTGLVESMGSLIGRRPLAEGVRFDFRHQLGELALGESIAVSGACLTVVDMAPERFSVELSPETLARTILGGLQEGDAVNFERAMKLDGRLGGHLVSGHVDGVGIIDAVKDHGDMIEAHLAVPEQLQRYTAEKGSITVDGVSLTTNSVDPPGAGAGVGLWIIPHTAQVTTIGFWKPGRQVNLEVDLIARYVERLLASGQTP